MIPFSSPFPASAALEPPKGKRRLGARSLLSRVGRSPESTSQLVTRASSDTGHAGASPAQLSVKSTAQLWLFGAISPTRRDANANVGNLPDCHRNTVMQTMHPKVSPRTDHQRLMTADQRRPKAPRLISRSKLSVPNASTLLPEQACATSHHLTSVKAHHASSSHQETNCIETLAGAICASRSTSLPPAAPPNIMSKATLQP